MLQLSLLTGNATRHFFEAEVKLAYIESALTPVPDWSINMQMRTPIMYCLTGSNSTILIGWNRISLMGG